MTSIIVISGSNEGDYYPLDQIRIGATTPLFTEKDFADRESALAHFKKVGERGRPTVID